MKSGGFLEKEGTCALCNKHGELELSHIIPKFVFKHLKKNSFSGKMRNTNNPNVQYKMGTKNTYYAEQMTFAVAAKLFIK